jgi:PAS domain S-box-containing protein
VGKTADELQGKCIYDFIPPDVARARKTVIEEVILTGKPARFEDERFGRSIDNSIYPVFDAAGKVTRLAVFAQDITMRKQTEDALKEKEERYRLLFNSGNDAIMVHHPIVEGMPDNFLEVNDIACQRFGYSREELLRLSPADIDDPEDPLDMTAIREKIRRDKHAIFEKVHVTRDGRKMPVEINAKLFDLHGEPTILSVLRDITQRKETEEKVKKLMSELERSNRELEQFAYVASHDLQEPLRKIASFAELLANRYKGQLDKKADTFIEYIVDGASRMRILINDILTYSHVMTRGKEFAETDCGAVISRVLGDLDPAIKKSNAAITCDALPTVMADAVQMEQLFQNLIGNAIKYHGEGPPRVHISAKKEKQEWVFSVRDNGIGIGPEHAERIFVIFQRLHTRAEYSGTGIGLAVCKKVVERLGGRIWVESVPGKGATFYFTITDKGGA